MTSTQKELTFDYYRPYLFINDSIVWKNPPDTINFPSKFHLINMLDQLLFYSAYSSFRCFFLQITG